jgi:hypothetical protein
MTRQEPSRQIKASRPIGCLSFARRISGYRLWVGAPRRPNSRFRRHAGCWRRPSRKGEDCATIRPFARDCEKPLERVEPAPDAHAPTTEERDVSKRMPWESVVYSPRLFLWKQLWALTSSLGGTSFFEPAPGGRRGHDERCRYCVRSYDRQLRWRAEMPSGHHTLLIGNLGCNRLCTSAPIPAPAHFTPTTLCRLCCPSTASWKSRSAGAANAFHRGSRPSSLPAKLTHRPGGAVIGRWSSTHARRRSLRQ